MGLDERFRIKVVIDRMALENLLYEVCHVILVQSRSFKVVLLGSDSKEKEEGLGKGNRKGGKANSRGLHGPENH